MSSKGSKFESCIEDFERKVKVKCFDASLIDKEISISVKRGDGAGIKSVNEIKMFLMNIIAKEADPNDYDMIGVNNGRSEVMVDSSPIVQYDLYLCHIKSHIEFEVKLCTPF